MSDDLDLTSHIRVHTMKRLEEIKRRSSTGSEYWLAREIGPILGYPVWGAFEPVVKRAITAIAKTDAEPSLHVLQTKKAVTAKNNAIINSRDYYLSRGGCYMVTLNGESSKPEVAAAQAYFAVQTRRMELLDAKIEETPDDVKRLVLRGKVTESFKRVSGVAEKAGVSRDRQAAFHDQRYVGLYGAHTADVYLKKGLSAKEAILDRIGTLELSAHEFQMNLAANVIERESIQGEQQTIAKNLEVAQEVRRAIKDSGATLPEDLPLAEHISSVRKRITGRRTKAVAITTDSTSSLPLFEQSLPSSQASDS